jgi:protein tyrosine/serine phosphatase
MMYRYWLSGGTFLVVALVCSAQSQPESKKGKEMLKPRNDLPGLTNFAQVSPILFRGAQPTEPGFKTLQKMGVKTIVNLRWLHSDRAMLKGLGLQYVHIECQAWNPNDTEVAQFIQVLRNSKNHPVFVHCQHGADRTGMMVAVYRIMEQDWGPAEAGKEIHQFGFHKVWTEIADYLKKFDRQKFNEQVKKTKEPRVELVN